jgi:hypothetical protein
MFDPYQAGVPFFTWLGSLGMQVLCKSSKEATEVCCSVCGQGFVLFWERQTRMEKANTLREVASKLRSHHNRLEGPEAHPDRGFLVPEWDGPIAYSGTAILGNAPSWAL